MSCFWTSRYHEHIKWGHSFINEPLFIALRWLAFPCRYDKMIARFGRSVLDFSRIFNQKFVFFFHARFGQLFSLLDHAWLCSENLVNFTYAAHNKGGALDNCCCFIDGTVRACCAMSEYQRLFSVCWFQEKSESFFKTFGKCISYQPCVTKLALAFMENQLKRFLQLTHL